MAAHTQALENQMVGLAQSFPSWVHDHWDANALDRWATTTSISHGELVTVRFLLAVWDPAKTWGCRSFDLMDALRVWDDRHRAAFLAWARHPWWP